jgi:hypothetical protein
VNQWSVRKAFSSEHDTAISDVVRINITARSSVELLKSHASWPITGASRVTQGLKGGSGVTAVSELCSFDIRPLFSWMLRMRSRVHVPALYL